MTDAPERVWVRNQPNGAVGSVWHDATSLGVMAHKDLGFSAFIRADISEAAIAALEVRCGAAEALLSDLTKENHILRENAKAQGVLDDIGAAGKSRASQARTLARKIQHQRAEITALHAAKAAARAEGERIGMERAAGIAGARSAGYADGGRKQKGAMLARALGMFFAADSIEAAIRAAMDARPPHPEYPSDADIDRSLSTARLLPDFLKPVDRP